MSWDQYITSNLMIPCGEGGATLDCAAIMGVDGSVWAKSDEFPVYQQQEWDTFIQAFSDPTITSVHIGGNKYMKTSADGDTMRCRLGKTGLIARKGQQAVIVGVYSEPAVTAPICSKIVESLADWMVDNGY